MKVLFSFLVSLSITLCALPKQDGLYLIDKMNNNEVVEEVFLDEGVILIGISNECEECALMEAELKKAASMVRGTKEKISFGLLKVKEAKDLKMQLKIEKFPALIALKEGPEPIIYESTIDYLQFVKFMRQLYGRGKIETVNSEK
jgi:thioredoxin-related protein